MSLISLLKIAIEEILVLSRENGFAKVLIPTLAVGGDLFVLRCPVSICVEMREAKWVILCFQSPGLRLTLFGSVFVVRSVLQLTSSVKSFSNHQVVFYLVEVQMQSYQCSVLNVYSTSSFENHIQLETPRSLLKNLRQWFSLQVIQSASLVSGSFL